MADYKVAKEAFVSDNAGTSLWEIQLVSCVGVVSYALYCSLGTLPRFTNTLLDRLLSPPLIDYITTFLPLLIALTVFSDGPGFYISGLLAVVFLIQVEGSLRSNWTRMHVNVRSAIPKPKARTSHRSGTSDEDRSTPCHDEPTPSTSIHFPHSPFLTIHRAHLSLMTIICILAVDFPIFPRRFGKTETFGSGLMDVGVGSFVLSAGIGAGGGWSKGQVTRVLSGAQGGGAGNVTADSNERDGKRRGGSDTLTQLRKASRRAIPLVALGMIRVIMVKGVEYPEHITEYGVHWNFFFTLAAMPFVLPLFSAARRRMGGARFWILALTLSSVNEILAQRYLQAWVLSPARNGLLGMNKEGLVSLPGYIAIYLFGIDLGCMIVPPDPRFLDSLTKMTSGGGPDAKNREALVQRMSSVRRPYETGKTLAWYTCTSWTLLGVMRAFGQPISRRMANFPYVLWTVAFNSTFLLGYLAVEIWSALSANTTKKHGRMATVPPLLAAINKNGLVLFLLANLLTGLINLSCETMYVTTLNAMLILVGYTLALSCVAWAVRTMRIAM